MSVRDNTPSFSPLEEWSRRGLGTVSGDVGDRDTDVKKTLHKTRPHEKLVSGVVPLSGVGNTRSGHLTPYGVSVMSGV